MALYCVGATMRRMRFGGFTGSEIPGWIDDGSKRRSNRAGGRCTGDDGVCGTEHGGCGGTAGGSAGDGAGTTFTLKVRSDLVLTNVVVRDKKTGAVVTGLKASDFTVLENGKPQKVASFDYQNVDEAAVLAEKTVSGKASIADLLNRNLAAAPEALRDHRLIVMFFDLSSMQPEDIDRAVDSATDYVNKKMQPADLVALVSLDTGLTMDQDFTSNKEALIRGLKKLNGTDGSGFAGGGDGTTDGTSDDGSSFTADDSEYNSLNTDRELYAIQSIAKSLERVEQKKSMMYFSGGLTRNGIENQASLRMATNAAVKANMAIYAVDTRGLQALPPVGDASHGSLRGTAAYSGQAMQNQLNANFASQETLATLSSDTGGKAFFDSNDFAPAFQQVQHDSEAYYILGFKSDECGAGWELSAPDDQAGAERCEGGVSAGVLCPGGLSALEDRGSGGAVDGADSERSAGDGGGGLSAGALLPAGGGEVLCAGVADRAGVADSVCAEWG